MTKNRHRFVRAKVTNFSPEATREFARHPELLPDDGEEGPWLAFALALDGMHQRTLECPGCGGKPVHASCVTSAKTGHRYAYAACDACRSLPEDARDERIDRALACEEGAS